MKYIVVEGGVVPVEFDPDIQIIIDLVVTENVIPAGVRPHLANIHAIIGIVIDDIIIDFASNKTALRVDTILTIINLVVVDVNIFSAKCYARILEIMDGIAVHLPVGDILLPVNPIQGVSYIIVGNDEVLDFF